MARTRRSGTFPRIARFREATRMCGGRLRRKSVNVLPHGCPGARPGIRGGGIDGMAQFFLAYVHCTRCRACRDSLRLSFIATGMFFFFRSFQPASNASHSVGRTFFCVCVCVCVRVFCQLKRISAKNRSNSCICSRHTQVIWTLARSGDGQRKSYHNRDPYKARVFALLSSLPPL